MLTQNISKYLLWDTLFIAILVSLSLFLISFYFNATTLNTNYPDWVVHAFRVKSLETYGLTSWTHSWSNGISLWRAYQFIPHYITIAIQKLTQTSITRSMVTATIILFVILRLFMYTFLRLLKFSPATAFICAVLSYDIAQYWGGVADYSLMFGFVATPMFLFLWVKYYQGKIQYLFPYILGLSFYIHPVLGYSITGLWIIGIIFSDQKIFSLSHATQFAIFLASASIFWLPLVVKDSYRYTSPVFANKYFLNLVLSGYSYFGLSLFILLALLLCTINAFQPVTAKFKWTKILYIFTLSYLIFIIIGLNVDLPKALAQLQFTRAVTIVGIGIIFVFASVVEKAIKIRSAAFKGAILVFLCLTIIEGIVFSSQYSPNPSKDFPEPITSYTQKYPQKNLTDGRIWTSEIGESGYYAPLNNQFPYSYMGHLESNQISPRISPLILYQPYFDKVPLANINRLNDYFKIAGVKYIFFDESSPFTNTILSSDKQIYQDLGAIKKSDAIYHAFQVPWEIRNSVAINPKFTKDMTTFPFNLDLTAINDQVELDSHVKNFVNMLYQPENKPLPISYPSYDTLQVKIPQGLGTNHIYINESYDTGWHGFFNQQPITLKPVGPNFTQAILPNLNQSGYIFLKHTWPPTFYLSLYFISLFPLELLLINISRKILLKKTNQKIMIKNQI